MILSDSEAAGPIRAAEVISALSFALDLTEGQPAGHAVRSCVFGMHLGAELALPTSESGDLYYALLMKDAGCSSNSSLMWRILGTDDLAGKRDAVRMDWTHMGWESLLYALSHVKTGAPFLERVRALFEMATHQKQNAKVLNQIRCERGSAIARRIGLSESAATAIHCLNEHWNGMGQPQGLSGERIPLLARIMNVAQTADVFHSGYGKDGPTAAMEVIRKRSGRWFDPNVARAFCSIAVRPAVWRDIENAAQRVVDLEPRSDILGTDDASLDNICLAFADVIDAKSPFTYRHSAGVSNVAVAIARKLSMSESYVTAIRRASLLHDIGKLSVSNAILDKPGKLTADEWSVVRKHPQYSLEILRRIPNFRRLSEIAGSHHEKLDGSGYYRNLSAGQLSLHARILTVADIYDALSAKRPYRDALPLEQVFNIMQSDTPRALDPDCLEALKSSIPNLALADDFLTSGGSAREAATAGAYVPSSDNVLDAMAISPAGLALLTSPMLELSLKAVFARGQFTDSANSDGCLNSNGLVPYGAVGGPVGSGPTARHFSFGFAVLPELLGDAKWRYIDPPGGPGGVSYGMLNNNSEILAIRAAAGIGVFLGPRVQLGATFGADYNSNTLQTAYVFQNFAPLAGLKTLLDLKTSGVGWNGSAGALVRASKTVQFGVAYKTRTTIKSTGSATGNAGIQFAAIGLGAARPDFRYTAQVDNILPQSASTNLVWQLNARTRLVGQADWINWKDAFVSLPVILTKGNNADINGLLGTDAITDSIPLQWRDQIVERCGVERSWLENMTVRAGYAHSNSPVPDSTLSPLTAAIARHTASAGIGYRHGRWNVDVAYAIDPMAEQNVRESALRSGEYSNSRIRTGTQSVISTFSIR